MSVSTSSIITIVDAVNYFNSKANSVLNSASYSSSSYPRFSGSVTAGRRTDASPNGTTYLTNPNAIPSGQLASKSISSLSISGGFIEASTLWSSISSIARTFNKVRRFSSNWRHKWDNTWQNVSSVSGTAVFNTSFPGVPSGSDVIDGRSTRWSRSGGNVTLSPSNSGISSGSLVGASTYINAVMNCYNAWYNSCYNSNTIYYTMYTCHANCHNSCHHDRGRR